jgi:thymidylate synthase (FAD)
MKVTLLNSANTNEYIANQASAICINKVNLEDTLSTKNLEVALKANHLSVAEHLPLSFLVEGVSRALLCQITRHRMISFTVQSQRYCKIDTSNKDWYVVPKSIDSKKGTYAYYEFHKHMEEVAKLYNEFLDMGMAKEDARAILPNACKTDFIMSMNARTFIEVCQKRTCSKSQDEIRYLFRRCRELVNEVYKNVTKLCYAPCITHNHCPETIPCNKYTE